MGREVAATWEKGDGPQDAEELLSLLFGSRGSHGPLGPTAVLSRKE